MLESRIPPARHAAACALVLVAAWPLAGCFSHGRGVRDVDRTPIVNTGVGASILYPGQAPPMPGETYPNPSAAGAAAGSAPAAGPTGAPDTAPTGAGGAGASSHVPAGTGRITMIGSAQQDEVRHEEFREEPIWYKYLALPFALAAAPFKKAAEAMADEPEPGPEVPHATTAPPRPASRRPPPDYETSRLRSLERELDERRARAQAAATGSPQTAGAPIGAAAGRAPSIAEELAALRRAPETAASGTASGPPRPAAATPGPAQGIVDRDGDGRIDQWIYREDGEIVRETFDENGDGIPDRSVSYDLETHRVSRIEEDSNGDGAVDSWTDYRDGKVGRRRVDADGDGLVDTWTFYRDGAITRHERDTTGDGFRDRVGFYRDGHLEREEVDADADGRTDAVLHYDAQERMVKKDEDTNGDGVVDLISYYEAGRLARRELLDPAALGSRSAPPDGER